MKVLLDECLPVKLRNHLSNHEVGTVKDMGWLGIKNGKLLAAAANAGFDVLLTVDAGMEYQQNPLQLPLAIVVVRVKSNAVQELRIAFEQRVTPFLSTVLEKRVYVL
jgi:predicted nuclease of predicted toxin-antitoxin system